MGEALAAGNDRRSTGMQLSMRSQGKPSYAQIRLEGRTLKKILLAMVSALVLITATALSASAETVISGSARAAGPAFAGNVPARPTAASATTTTTRVAFVQADDTGTINKNTTSIASGHYNKVFAHDTKKGHTVILVIQTLTDPGTQTHTIRSISSRMGTFKFVNSYNDLADNEIWICTDTTGAADTLTVHTSTNAWNAFAIEFNRPATGVVNGGGRVTYPNYLAHQSWKLSRLAAGDIAFVAVDTLDAYNTGPAAPWKYYNSGYWSFINGTSAAWRVARSSAHLTATWQTDGGESSSQGVVLSFRKHRR